MVIMLLASFSTCLASAASAFAVFFWASFAARFWASTESDAVAASRASGMGVNGCSILGSVSGKTRGVFVPADQIRSYMTGSFFSSHSWHFLTVPPYSQYYLAIVKLRGSDSRGGMSYGRGERTSGGRVQTGQGQNQFSFSSEQADGTTAEEKEDVPPQYTTCRAWGSPSGCSVSAMACMCRRGVGEALGWRDACQIR